MSRRKFGPDGVAGHSARRMRITLLAAALAGGGALAGALWLGRPGWVAALAVVAGLLLLDLGVMLLRRRFERARSRAHGLAMEAWQRQLFDGMGDGVLVLRGERLLFHNAALAQLFGTAASAVALGPEHLAQRLAPEHRPLWRQICQRHRDQPGLPPAAAAHAGAAMDAGVRQHSLRLLPRPASGDAEPLTKDVAEPAPAPDAAASDGARWLQLQEQPTWLGGEAATLCIVRELAAPPHSPLPEPRHRIRTEPEARPPERTGALAQTLAALRDNEAFLRTVADNMPGLIGYWDAEQRCRFANRGHQRWFGLTPEQMIGRRADEVSSAEVYTPLRPFIEAALAGRAQHFQHDLQRRDGSRATVWIQFIPDLQGDSVCGLFVLVTDVTELHQTEQRLERANAELLRARDRAEAASRAKTDFLANMSHEIRTPMNAIIGLNHMLLRELAGTHHEDRLHKLGAAAGHLLAVISDVLDLSKIEAGRLELSEAEFALDDVLRRAIDLVIEPARGKGLELLVEAGTLPLRLRGDATRLSQALVNLLGNAVKFTDQGWVRLRVEALDPAQPGRLRFTVTDTGPGIAAAQQAQLFDAFVQADASLTRRHGGTGLGLAISRRIAEAMGGEAGLESLPGQGSSFWFTVRLAVASDAAPLPALRLAGPALVIDDLGATRHALRHMLEAAGATVRAVGQAAQAQGVLAGSVHPAVVLIDAELPEPQAVANAPAGHGRQDPNPATPAWRSLLPLALGEGRRPIVLLLTGRDPAALQARALASGASAVLAKPVLPLALRAALGQAVPAAAAVAAAPAVAAGPNAGAPTAPLQPARTAGPLPWPPRPARPHNSADDLADKLANEQGREQGREPWGEHEGDELAGFDSADSADSMRRALALQFDGLRVLLADDSALNLEVGAALLASVGLMVDQAGGGEEAVALAADTAYAAILLDVQMPGTDGLQAAQRIRAMAHHAHTPVIAMTASVSAADRARCLAHGMNDHVTKPVDARTLYTTLQHWLRLGPEPAPEPPQPGRYGPPRVAR
ncbi:response regulator [Aquabacterium sp. OR-4]|uniref:response regulator n=1 Tax=Aquabacterium sp. OR-4 TaxID=2978127 RepID=UPI0021B30032|nr:response regulator [Aquabacterium sp. OR-4]MDT7834629.1 response regulator [Aquabacterium sp. OR-4]